MVQFFKKLFWTEHSKLKMKQYGFSKQKLLNILYKPERKEQGIASGTSAVMKTNKKYPKNKSLFSVEKDKQQDPPSREASAFGSTESTYGQTKSAWRIKAPGEIWIMYKDVKNSSTDPGQVRKIISAWRYPGISKPGEEIPIPEDIRQEIINGEIF